MDREDVEKLAELSRIDISSEEADRILGDLTSILGYISELEKVKDLGESTSFVGEHYNVMRDDATPHESGLYMDDILGEMPLREGDYLKVKKIL